MMSVTSLHICSHTLDYKESYVEIVFALYQLWRIPDPDVSVIAGNYGRLRLCLPLANGLSMPIQRPLAIIMRTISRWDLLENKIFLAVKDNNIVSVSVVIKR